MSDEDQELPSGPLENPTGSYPPPPPETAAQLLPFDQLLWEHFEWLCLRVARLTGKPGRARRYGVRGQLQSGIDFYMTLANGRYVTYQCKRIKGVSPADIKAAVEEFLKRKRWSDVSDKFVFCTSEGAVGAELSDAIEAQGKRLAEQANGIEFEVWDADELSQTLKEHEDIVQDFFGPYWVEAFFGRTGSQTETLAALLQEVRTRPPARTQFVTHEWAPGRLKDLLESLREDDPETFGSLNDLLGSPPEKELVRAAAKVPPEWLRKADARVWDVFARTAESQGEWAAASEAWEQLAKRQSSLSARAGSLVSAAIAARMTENIDRYDKLIAQARAADDGHPRLVLEQLSEDTPPAEQLAIIRELDSEDPDDLAQIAARRTMGELLTPNVAAARVSLEEVKERLPDSILAASLSISLTAQEGRLAVMEHRSLDRAALLSAAAEAESVRQRLIKQVRWSESTRLVMLRADIYALLGERPAASKILMDALAEEQRTTEQKIVLASSAAERALDWELAREFLDGADETPTTTRLRLEIKEAIGTPAERKEALCGLDRMVREAGPEAEHAAFVRLAATLGQAPTPWSDQAAVYLKEHGYERAAVQAEAFYRLQDSGYEQAVEVIAPYSSAPWALATRLRLALSPHAPPEAAAEAAENLLAIGPSHAARIEAAQGFGRAKNFARARQELVSVARDRGAPDSARADAYEKLMHVVGDELGDWHFAFELHTEWIQVAPTDNRAPKWAPRIANRRSHG
jgi:hypothetical protein